MPVHWVNYDLKTEDRDYSPLTAYLESHPAWANPLDNSYFIKTDATAGELREGIRALLNDNDTVVVVSVEGQSWATWGLSEPLNRWLHNNL